MKLSVIVPIFNEQITAARLLKSLAAVKEVKEIVVVDDGSTDNTAAELAKLKSAKIKVFTKANGGKGSAVRFGLDHVSGTHVLIQDADLEYDPRDIPRLLQPIEDGRVEIVYGSRFLGPHLNLLFWHRLGNTLLNLVVNILYNTTLSDMETCYKIVPAQLLRSLNLTANGFELEPEITCKLLKKGHKIFEVPISYIGRDFSQGKKITWRDGIVAIKTIFEQRLMS